MDFFEAVTSRYTYRGQFESTPIPQEDVDKILTAALAAPVGKRVQTNSYVVVTDPALLTELTRILKRYGTGPLALIMLTEDRHIAHNFEIENYCAATENVLLAITALGYATVWTDGVLHETEINDGVRKLLNIPPHKNIRAVLPIGVPVAPGAPSEKPSIADLVVYNRFPE